jgi:hypothetical protein
MEPKNIFDALSDMPSEMYRQLIQQLLALSDTSIGQNVQ